MDNLTPQQELALYKEDGMFSLYFALNRKINEISRSLNDTTLSLASEDRSFDRFIKLTSSLKDIVDAVNSIRINYLKMDEKQKKES